MKSVIIESRESSGCPGDGETSTKLNISTTGSLNDDSVKYDRVGVDELSEAGAVS
jgi:hypothetical protein